MVGIDFKTMPLEEGLIALIWFGATRVVKLVIVWNVRTRVGKLGARMRVLYIAIVESS